MLSEEVNLFYKSFSKLNLLTSFFKIYLNIKGSTDSEYMFALFLNFYQDIKRKYPKEKKIDAMVEAIYKVITAVDKMTLETRKVLFINIVIIMLINLCF